MAASWTWRLVPWEEEHANAPYPPTAKLFRLSCIDPFGKEWIDNVFLNAEDIKNLYAAVMEKLP